MGNTYDVDLGFGVVMAFSGTEVFLPCTDWGKGAGILKARAMVELAQLDGSIEVWPAIQVAQFSDNPGAHTKIGTARTAVDVFPPEAWTTLSTATDSNQLIRFGWVVRRESGTSPVSAWVSGTITVVAD